MAGQTVELEADRPGQKARRRASLRRQWHSSENLQVRRTQPLGGHCSRGSVPVSRRVKPEAGTGARRQSSRNVTSPKVGMSSSREQAGGRVGAPVEPQPSGARRLSRSANSHPARPGRRRNRRMPLRGRLLRPAGVALLVCVASGAGAQPAPGRRAVPRTPPAAITSDPARAQALLTHITDELWEYGDRFWHAGRYEDRIGLDYVIIELEPGFVEAYGTAAWLIDSNGRR